MPSIRDRVDKLEHAMPGDELEFDLSNLSTDDVLSGRAPLNAVRALVAAISRSSHLMRIPVRLSRARRRPEFHQRHRDPAQGN